MRDPYNFIQIPIIPVQVSLQEHFGNICRGLPSVQRVAVRGVEYLSERRQLEDGVPHQRGIGEGGGDGESQTDGA